MTTLAAIRRILGAILLIGMIGTAVELLLLGHDEDAVQILPLALLAAGIVAVGWRMATGSSASAAAVQIVMVLFLAAGAAGIYFHYQANVEFAHEGNPSLAGRALLWSVLRAKVPPALAPGVLAQLGLLGLAYTYRDKER